VVSRSSRGGSGSLIYLTRRGSQMMFQDLDRGVVSLDLLICSYTPRSSVIHKQFPNRLAQVQTDATHRKRRSGQGRGPFGASRGIKSAHYSEHPPGGSASTTSAPQWPMDTYSGNWFYWHCVCVVNLTGKFSIVVLGRRRMKE
jgi:hypothetical protein